LHLGVFEAAVQEGGRGASLLGCSRSVRGEGIADDRSGDAYAIPDVSVGYSTFNLADTGVEAIVGVACSCCSAEAGEP
jgi:hypothetical protein